MKYRGLIFDLDYFEDKAAEEIAALSEYVNSHDVHVGIVTTENKPVYTKWLKKAPITVDYTVGGGDIKKGRFKFIRKPEGLPLQVAVAWFDLDAGDVLSICTKDIDKEASEKAGISMIVNPNPKDIIPLLSDDPKKEKQQINIDIPVPTTGIYGAVCGDIIGSPYEIGKRRTKDYNFELFIKQSGPSDDTILTLAIAKWLMGDRSEEDLKHQLISFANRYPKAHWGHGFKTWLASKEHEKREAGSNGSAMRVSPVGYAATSIEECLALAKQTAELTHNTPEGIAGAQAIAASVFLARQGGSDRLTIDKIKANVKAYIEQQFGYNLDHTIDEIRATYDIKEKFSLACNKCAAEAIVCWLVSDTYEATIRNAVSLGGDADTIAAMAGSIAAATPGMEIPQDIAEKCYALVPDDLKETLVGWYAQPT